jgi:lipopolysaccharide biosynthesis regulator YciM
MALADGDLRTARAALGKASGFDAHCARVALVAARIAFAEKRYKEVQRQLAKARDLDSELVQETLDLYQSAADELNDQAGYIAYLRACLDQAPVLAVVERLAVDIEQKDGPDAANEFVLEQLLRNPSLAGFVSLLNRLDRGNQPLPPDQLALVRRFSQSLLQRQAEYRCKNCGFSGKTLMWQCPSCRSWGTIKPIVANQREDA